MRLKYKHGIQAVNRWHRVTLNCRRRRQRPKDSRFLLTEVNSSKLAPPLDARVRPFSEKFFNYLTSKTASHGQRSRCTLAYRRIHHEDWPRRCRRRRSQFFAATFAPDLCAHSTRERFVSSLNEFAFLRAWLVGRSPPRENSMRVLLRVLFSASSGFSREKFHEGEGRSFSFIEIFHDCFLAETRRDNLEECLKRNILQTFFS